MAITPKVMGFLPIPFSHLWEGLLAAPWHWETPSEMPTQLQLQMPKSPTHTTHSPHEIDEKKIMQTSLRCLSHKVLKKGVFITLNCSS